MGKVIVTEALEPLCEKWLAERAEVVWRRHGEGESLDAELADADGLVVRTYTLVNDALLDRAPKLKVVGRAGVGLDNIDLPACRRRGVQVVYTPDANTQAVVDYVIALMLDDLRPRTTLTGPITPDHFHQLRRQDVGRQLDTLTLGILGFGRIGKRLGRVAAAFGMKLQVNDLLDAADLRTAVDYDFDFVDKAELYAAADVLCVHVDGRPSNRHLLDAAAFAQLRPDCLLINAARGMLIDHAALAAWLQSVAEHGGRAIIDVHDPEPPGDDYCLFGVPNVTLLPHLASRTQTAVVNMSWVVRDVAAVLEGSEPVYPAPSEQ